MIGRLLRAPLRLIPPSAVLPVIQGPLAGGRWIAGAATHGCWLGTYERAAVELFVSLLEGARVVYDIGAHAGYYTLVAATRLGPRGTVIAFEPNPRNCRYLEEHVRLNRLANVVVRQEAVADVTGELTFDDGDSSFVGRLSDAGTRRVAVVSLDCGSEDGSLPDPDVMKIDVEGAETRVLSGASELIGRSHPAILLSVHGEATCAHCTRWLEAQGYRVDRIEGALLIARHASRNGAAGQNLGRIRVS